MSLQPEQNQTWFWAAVQKIKDYWWDPFSCLFLFPLPFCVSLLRPPPPATLSLPHSLSFLHPPLHCEPQYGGSSVGMERWEWNIKIAGESQEGDYKYKFWAEKGIAICFRVFWLLAQEEYRLNALQLQKKTLTTKIFSETQT